jgi:hypothetical protein
VSTNPLGVLDDLAAEVDRLFATLESLARRTSHLMRAERAEGGPTSTCLSALDDELTAALGGNRAAGGIGVVVCPGVLVDRPREIHWYWKPPGRPPERLRVELDPLHFDCYDYTTTDWYLRGTGSSNRSVTGPYVDYLCTNEYVITLTVPVLDEGEVVGLAGVDVLVAHVEELLLPRLLSAEATVAVVTAEGRVVSSSSAALPPGTPVPGAGGASHRLLALPEATRPPLPWRVLVERPAARKPRPGSTTTRRRR